MRSRATSVAAALTLLLLVLVPSGAVAASTPPPPAEPPPAAGAPSRSPGAASAEAAPLVVLVDLSGSMDEDDGTGTVKLDGAKRALLDVVGKQPPQAAVGLWTYPGGSEECAPGGYLGAERPQPLGDAGRLTASIRTLTAGGGTPTGPALQAVATSLEREQVGRATVLLVSDGESNCGQDPCDAAKDVLAQGLDVTVQAVGFKISAAGEEELRCIAAATGGAYTEVRDSAELADRVAALSVSPLALSVEASATTIAAGSALTITAEVRNRSLVRAEGVSLSLVMTGGGEDPLFLAVVPPVVRLGAIPPGEELPPYTWTLSTSGARMGEATYEVVAASPSAERLVESGKITVTDEHPGVGQAGPVLKDALEHGSVVVMGDSYSSGEGAGDYDDLISRKMDLCHRSPRTYGVQLFGPDSTTVIACSGAIAADVTAPNEERDVPAQVDQLRKLMKEDAAPGLVLLSLGGNDAGFGDIIKGCFFSADGTRENLTEEILTSVPAFHLSSQCSQDPSFVRRTEDRLEWLADDLSRKIVAIDATVNAPERVEGRGGWRAPVVVMAYPQILPAARRASCLFDVTGLGLSTGTAQLLVQAGTRQVGFSDDEVEWLNAIGQKVNNQVRAGVATSVARGAPAYFVAPVQEAVQPNHTTCDTEAYINPLSAAGAYVAGGKDLGSGKVPDVRLEQGRAQEFVHPNTEGYRAMADVLVSWSQGVEAPARTKRVAGPAPATATASDPVATVVLDGAAPTTVDVRAGDAVRIEVRGMAPGTTVTVQVRSAPRVLGNLTAGADGTARGVVHVPPDLPAGAHTLVADGAGPDGAYRSSEQPVRVGPPRPWWFWPTGIAVLLAAAGACVLLGASRTSGRAAR